MIQQWFSQESDLGVVSKTFQLSSHPVLGDWSIQVQVNVSIHVFLGGECKIGLNCSYGKISPKSFYGQK